MPLEEMTYREGMDQRMMRFETDMRKSAADQQKTLEAIEKQVKYTNGKVRKIIMAILVIGGIVVGQLFTSKEIISLVISTLK